MTNPPDSSDHDWKQKLDPSLATELLLAELADLANQEDVPGVARACLELLNHRDSQVRVWAAEALESSAAPAGDETESLIDWLGKLLDQQSASAKKAFVWPGAEPTSAAKSSSTDDELADSLLADQLYWTATMIGRIGTDAAAAAPMLARLEALKDTPSARPFHDAAARAERMRKRIAK